MGDAAVVVVAFYSGLLSNAKIAAAKEYIFLLLLLYSIRRALIPVLRGLRPPSIIRYTTTTMAPPPAQRDCILYMSTSESDRRRV